MNDEELKIGTKLYYARIMPTLGVFDIYDMKVVALYDTYFAAQEKRDKRRFLFYYTDLNKIIFKNRLEALELAQEKESENKYKVSTETYYEEY